MNSEVPTTTNRLQLKIVALKQRLSEIVVSYEDKDSDRRVEITELSEHLNALVEENNELREAVRRYEAEKTETEENTEVEGDSAGDVPED